MALLFIAWEAVKVRDNPLMNRAIEKRSPIDSLKSQFYLIR